MGTSRTERKPGRLVEEAQRRCEGAAFGHSRPDSTARMPPSNRTCVHSGRCVHAKCNEHVTRATIFCRNNEKV